MTSPRGQVLEVVAVNHRGKPLPAWASFKKLYLSRPEPEIEQDTFSS